MADRMTKAQRSYTMSRIRSTKTLPELKLKSRLSGFVYHPKGIYGKPDFADRKNKVAVFVDGCFWHKCPEHYIKSKTNSDYWTPKIKRNVLRDKLVEKTLAKQGWKVVRFWEHELKSGYERCLDSKLKHLAD